MQWKWALLGSVILVGLLLTWGVAQADEGTGKSESKVAGKFLVEFIAPASGAVVGDNDVSVHLKDAATGQPVARESLRIELSMDGGDMSHMSHSASSNQSKLAVNLAATKGGAGHFSGKAHFTDAGDWKVNVILDPANPQASTSFGVHVVARSSGPNWLIIGGFVGTIMAVVIMAAVMKSRSRRLDSSVASE